MKKLVFFILTIMVLALSASCASSDIAENPDEWNHRTYTIFVPDKTQAELYDLARGWFVGGFVSAQEVIHYTSADMGSIVGKYTYLAKEPKLAITRQVINLKATDGQVVVQFYHPERASSTAMEKNVTWEPTIYISAFEETHKDWNLIIENLTEYLNTMQ